MALGGEGRVRLVEVDHGRLGATRWEAAVDFFSAVLVASGSSLWAAGSALGGAGVDDYDWEQLVGGGLAQLDLATGAVWRPPGSATTLPGEAGEWRWSWRTACPAVWDAAGSCTRWPPGAPVTTQLTSEAGWSPVRHRTCGGGRAANSSSVSIAVVTGSTQLSLRTINQLVRDSPAHRASGSRTPRIAECPWPGRRARWRSPLRAPRVGSAIVESVLRRAGHRTFPKPSGLSVEASRITSTDRRSIAMPGLSVTSGASPPGLIARRIARSMASMKP